MWLLWALNFIMGVMCYGGLEDTHQVDDTPWGWKGNLAKGSMSMRSDDQVINSSCRGIGLATVMCGRLPQRLLEGGYGGVDARRGGMAGKISGACEATNSICDMCWQPCPANRRGKRVRNGSKWFTECHVGRDHLLGLEGALDEHRRDVDGVRRSTG